MVHRSFRKLDPDGAARRVAVALAAARAVDPSVRIPATFTWVDPAAIRRAPAWVARAAILKSGRAWWLWFEPRPGRASDGQCVLDLPAGRYMVETLETRRYTWVSCESAAGSPLVIGVPFTGRPVVACIRRLSRTSKVPRE